MTLLQEIIAARRAYIEVHAGREPNKIYLSRGMLGILANELEVPEGVALKQILGMTVDRQPPFLLTYEAMD